MTRPDILSSRRARWIAATVAAIIVIVVGILVARALRTLGPVSSFIADHPGVLEPLAGTPAGLPVWLAWQHYLNAFFLVLIVKTGWQVRTTRRPPAYWARRGSRGSGTKISVTLWLHLALDVLWVLNGVVFLILIFATGHWARIVPTSWEIVPNAVSVFLQYASLDWPTENGWIAYNALQVLSYFGVVFILAPLAIVTGLRMSPLWPSSAARLSRAYPIEVARAVHFPTMLAFVAFVVVHVTLVAATGLLRNLNHMYAVRDDASWWGLLVFVIGTAVMVAAWFLAGPTITRTLAALTGSVTRN